MQEVAPQNYRIHLIPDLTDFTFAGNVTLQVEAPTAIEALVLNILDLSNLSCEVEQNGHWVECKFETDEAKEELQIFFPQKTETDDNR